MAKRARPASGAERSPPAAPSGVAAGQTAHVLLLRGINVGGKNLLPMKSLAQLVTELGAGDVRTYIQSGNVVLRAAAGLASTLPAKLAEAISARHALQVPVVMRSAAELRQVIDGNPFLAAGHDPATLHVAFLASRPGPAEVAALDPARSPPDRFEVRGQDIYLSLPTGAGHTRLTNDYFDRRLGTISTGRNWRTVLTLMQMVTDAT